MNKAKRSLLAFIFIFATGCNRSEIIFDFADTFAVNKVDDYLDLTSEQKAALKKDIQADLKVAKKDVLPKLAQKLRAIEPQIDNGAPSAEFVASEMGHIQNEMKKATAYFKETAIKTSLTLSPQQFEHFAKEVRENIEDKEDLEEALQQVETRYRRGIEFWMGGISKQQREKITRFLFENPYPTSLEAKSKEYVLEKFLVASKSQDELKKFVVAFMDDYESLRLPEYTAALNAHKKSFQKFLAEDFWTTVNATQKKQLKKNLLARADEFERIAAKP